jgi:hypothetical protein
MSLPRAFVDTNVLFPFSLLDLLLALDEDRLHTVLWSDPLLHEWQRVIARTGRRSGQAAASVAAAIRRSFPDGYVPTAASAHLLDHMPGTDPDDRLHMAAAIGGAATHLVTHNIADFPAVPLHRFGVRVLDPDSYLVMLLDATPAEMIDTVIRIADEKRRPPMTAGDLLGYLDKAGAHRFASRLRPLV